MNRKSTFVRAAASAVAIAAIISSVTIAQAAAPPGCGQGGPVDQAVCSDSALSALDAKLIAVYGAASKAATGEQKNRLAAEQQHWLDERNRCSGADRATCIRTLYTNRIAELQAQFKLVASRGPFRFVCDKNRNSVLVAQYFETDPSTARFTHDGRTVTAFVAQSGSGARYEGPSVSYWEHQGEASVVWFGRKMTCATNVQQRS